MIYQELEAYKNLNEHQKLIFRNLFEKLLFNEQITLSDWQLANFYHMSQSAWEKYLRHYVDVGLLERNRIITKENGKYKTVARQIRLNPHTFTFTSLKDYNSKIQKAEAMLNELKSKGNQNGFID